MTIEDPIEFLHGHKKLHRQPARARIGRAELGDALKAALRQTPARVLGGEMRDLETISTALTSAETGHLVSPRWHTQDAAQTIDRIIDVFPAHQQGQVRVQAVGPLQGIMTQQLIPTADGSGRAVACEVLSPRGDPKPDPRGQDAPDYSVLQTSSAQGMQTMDRAWPPARTPGKDQPEGRRDALQHTRRASPPDRRQRPAGGLAGDEAPTSSKGIDLPAARPAGRSKQIPSQAVADQLKQRGCGWCSTSRTSTPRARSASPS